LRSGAYELLFIPVPQYDYLYRANYKAPIITGVGALQGSTLTGINVELERSEPVGSAPPPEPRVIESVSQSHSRWREGNGMVQYSRGPEPPRGTTFSFVLEQDAVVSFTFVNRLGGREVDGHCVAQTNANRRRAGCRRSLTRGRLSLQATPG
jgi:hypothetical protein